MKRHLFPFTYQYYDFKGKSERLTEQERLKGAWDLLKDMKESGKFLVSPEQRDILHSYGRNLSSLILEISGELPWALLAMPLGTSWEIEPDEIQAQSQAYVLQRSHRTLFKLREFDSDSLLHPLLSTPLLAAHRDDLPLATSKAERVGKTIAYLLQKQLSCHGPVLLEFLALLRDREPVGSGLRDELSVLQNAIALVLSQTPEETFRLGFANRESEKKSIRSFLIYHFYLAIQAPSGMGKTYLLREIQKDIEKFNWIPVWIDFASESHRPLRDNEHLFLQEFCQQAFGGEIFDLSNQKRALEEIGDKMTWMDNEIVIFLDHADYADNNLLEWLRDKFLFPFATEWVPVRVVTASQQLIPPWHTPNHEHAQTLTLSPLDSSAICSIISDVVTRFGSEAAKERKARQDEAWQNDLRTMAEGLLKLSGGHPETIARLLRHAAEEDGFLTPAYFTDHRAAKESLAKVTGEYVL